MQYTIIQTCNLLKCHENVRKRYVSLYISKGLSFQLGTRKDNVQMPQSCSVHMLYGSMQSLYFNAHLKTSYVILKRCTPWEYAFHFFKKLFVFEKWITVLLCILFEMQLENSGFGSVFVCNPETEEDMYRCYSTSCQL